MLGSDLAELYGVTPKRLNEQVRRNRERFPKDFMFKLTKKEVSFLRSQFATLEPTQKQRGKHTKYPPYAFTEQGVAMLSSILNSARAIKMNIAIIRTFVLIRQTLATHRELANKLEKLEKRYDERFRVVFDALRKLITPPPESSPPIGFKVRK